MTFNYCIC